jgi:hypothetical protein
MPLLTLALFGWSCDHPPPGADADADTDADSDTDTDAAPPADETLAGDDRILDCDGGHGGYFWVDAKGERRWGAVRMSPNPKWTFVPAQLTYTMAGGTSFGSDVICHSNYAHDIMIWTQRRVDDGPDPPYWSPYVIPVPAGTGPDDEEAYERTEDLGASGIVVNPGEDLFVAIQFSGTFPDLACLQICILDDEEFPLGRVLWLSASGDDPFYFYDGSAEFPSDGFDFEVTGSYDSYE